MNVQIKFDESYFPFLPYGRPSSRAPESKVTDDGVAGIEIGAKGVKGFRSAFALLNFAF